MEVDPFAPTILVVEDDIDVLEALTETLAANGFRTVEARDGHDAIEKIRAAAPDVIVTDITMPESDGIELIRLIRRADERVRIIAMSGSAVGRQFLKAASLLGADVTIEKPFAAPELIEAIRRLISHA